MARSARDLPRPPACCKCGYPLDPSASRICPECGATGNALSRRPSRFLLLLRLFAKWTFALLGFGFGLVASFLIVLLPGPHADTSFWPVVFPLELVFYPDGCPSIMLFCAGGIVQWSTIGLTIDLLLLLRRIRSRGKGAS